MRAYGAPLTAFITRVVRSGADAEDVRQQVFLEAFRGIDRYEGRASIWSWLCGIAYNRSIDCIKTKKRTTSIDGFDVLEALGVQTEQAMSGEVILIRKALERCLAKLRSEIRAQVIMRFGEQLSYQEIGELLGEEHGTVQVRLSRVLPKLRKCLRSEGMR
jgi:RNA polymerase sigma-70 factor, ECF subfamily